MVVVPDDWERRVGGSAVDYRGAGVVEVPQCGPRQVDVDLVGGRDRWSVGGRIAEGPRWWRGQLAPVTEDVSIRAGTVVELALDNGRKAPAVVESSPVGPRVVIRGLGPPPFEVP